MALGEHLGSLTGIAIVTTVAVLLGFVLVRLRQPPVVGYILTGVVLGPTGFGLVGSSGAITLLAELGVIMLLFLIGMELSVRHFSAVAGPSAAVACGQIVVAVLVSGIFGAFLGWPVQQIMLLGFIVAVSSTAVGVQMLGELGELRTGTGRITVGVLIAQDIAVVPMLILVGAFGGDGGWRAVIIKVGIAAVILFLFLRFLATRPGNFRLPFSEALSGRVDMMALASVAFCFAAAAVTSLLGLSAAFGAFVAGLVIAGSTLRHEAIAATHPIQSVLIVVFFLSIGLLIDLNFIAANLGTVIFFVVAVLIAKTVVNVALLRIVGQPWEQAFPAGLIIAQVGEFSFVLAATGLANGAIGSDAYRLAITVIAISLLVSPFWMASVRRFDALASDGISDFRAALEEIYSDEIGEIRRGRMAIARLVAWVFRRGNRSAAVVERRRGATEPTTLEEQGTLPLPDAKETPPGVEATDEPPRA